MTTNAHRCRRNVRRFAVCAVLIGVFSTRAGAEPWLEVGDRSLRSDVELLADRGLIDSPVSSWPIPAGQVGRLSNAEALLDQPVFVQLAARRVIARLLGEGQPEGWHPEADLHLATEPDVVRDFGTMARDQIDSRAAVVVDESHLSAGLKVGDQSGFDGSRTQLALDGSYLSGLLDDWQVYGGWVDQWYGPGWTSSLILSNNARPFPKLGLMRNQASAPESRWFHWLGPWQLNLFTGVLDGPRYDRNTLAGGFRLVVNPVRNLEIGLSRLTEFCGEHHSCSPLKAAFQFSNDSGSANTTNDEAAVDIRYHWHSDAWTFAPYVQLMNEDTGPFTHSDTSYLAGFSVAGAFGGHDAQWRTTIEYTDTVPTVNMFGFDHFAHGVAYNNSGYVDGMRYRDRTLGFSLDSDSCLLSISENIVTERGLSYRFVYYRANVSSQALSNEQLLNGNTSTTERNSVSAVPVTFDQFEMGISIPYRVLALDAAVRARDASISPGETARVSAEAGISYRF